ncbi:hypothetical protein BDA99DRAFT_316746 [Phascolomyces articulosus]|uniref:Uncharacterized protein n=1 Tax=Phascolomyces articulosus TaxID=60185 RepID=A0AAD5JKG5_9FUNG|nr:hypothetical protein BDA99DRAFT_316746 [Phascolomyces articulosus]
MNRTRAAAAAAAAAGINNNPMRQQQQSFLAPHHQSQPMVQQQMSYHHHLTAPTHHSQPLVRRASANSILEPHRRLPSRPAQPHSTLSYPPAIFPAQAQLQQQLQPIAPMPTLGGGQQQLPYIQIEESPTPGHKRQLAAPPQSSSQPPSSASSTSSSSSDYFNYGGHDRGGNIHHSLANLSIQSNRNGGAGPARKRARSRTSSIDMLASAAEYVNSEHK